jgi:RHH-type proline utilization regulon transcriptional repressor/proline dehydrogenase/delta 1-pyrroline-5-carboxylate dehydrogenase
MTSQTPRDGSKGTRLSAIPAPDESTVRTWARRIADAQPQSRPSASDRLLANAMDDPAFRANLFRFVDAYPALVGSGDIVEHLDAYLDPQSTPTWIRRGIGAARSTSALGAATTAAVMRSQIASMAKRYIVASDAATAAKPLRARWDAGEAFTCDLLGEKTLTTAEAERYAKRVGDLHDGLVQITRAWPNRSVLESDALGVMSRVHISIKATALAVHLHSISPSEGIAEALSRLAPLAERASTSGALLAIDMEHYDVKDLTMDMTHELWRRHPQLATGVVVQGYLRDAGADIDKHIAVARALKAQRGAAFIPPQVRLVKGAYWDAETVGARANGWPIPVWTNKARTDFEYERHTRTLLQAGAEGLLRPAFASHNIRSLAVVIAAAGQAGLAPNAYELQLLSGMAEPLHSSLVSLGFRVRAYTPIGELVPGMGYLVRRLLENTSNSGFVNSLYSKGESIDALVAPPEVGPDAVFPEPGFRNAAPTPTFVAQRRDELAAAFSAQRSTVALAPFIGGKALAGEPTLTSINPSNLADVVATVRSATVADARTAVATAGKSSWLRAPLATRVKVIRRTADLMEKSRDELSAMIAREVGKSLIEADNEVCEAIDFCRYYSEAAEALETYQGAVSVPGEHNVLRYRPRGVAAVIGPWNFPLAIPCGMTTAALVSGNPVVLKPAEQAPAIARRLVAILHEAGVPTDALAYLPGEGDVGAALVADPEVALIVFTGSAAVGQQIQAAAAVVHPGQRAVKRVIAETGGKNAIIVDDDADLDVAVPAIISSAFGFGGQKCSACSRVIAVGSIHDALVQRLAGAVAVLDVGSPANLANVCGPVIEPASVERYEKALAHAAEIGRVHAQRAVDGAGYFIGPAVVEVPQDDYIWREELFAPILAVSSAPTFDAAIAVLNDTPYALTAGLMTRHPAHVARAAELRAGNVYVNRGTTGAVVARQPFGGFGLSGTGPKAGGPDYLLQFVDAQVVTENTLRQGFTPETL